MALSIFSRKLLRCVWNEEAVRRVSLSPMVFSEDESSKKSSAANKLHSLLQDIIKDEAISTDNIKKVAVEGDVVPKKRKRPENPKDLGKKIVDSAKQVAKELDGKPEVTEAELLHRLLFKNRPLTESITKASGSETLKELLSGMDVEKEPQKKPLPLKDKQLTRAEQVKMMLGKKGSFKPSETKATYEKVDIFGGDPLGIFKPDELSKSEVSMETWEALEKKEFRLLLTHPPMNIYEQLIQWTERGMVWQFPINNEQGMEEEAKTDFTEHIFLEQHLEAWCPEKGPLRHFMELVCVGLSQNHWLTAEEKKQHILWYKDYFGKKRALLKELEIGDIKELSAT